MARGTILADNWLATLSGVSYDALTFTPSAGANSNLTDYDSSARVEYTMIAGVVDIVINMGVKVNPNTIAVINHNLTLGATRGVCVITSADNAAQDVRLYARGQGLRDD